MKRLSKAQLSTKASLIAQIEEAKSDLDAAVDDYNEKAKALFEDKVESAVNALNAKIEEFNAFREDVHSEQESYFDEKSEKWQEGDAGSNYGEWRDAWDNEVPTVDEPEFEEIDPQVDGIDSLDSDFPDEVSG